MNIQIKDLQTLKDNNVDVNTIKFLYKRTSTGAIQIWGQELSSDKYRSVLGQLEGKLQVSEWTTAKPKNIGKKNERLADDQAKFEVDNNYTKKLKEGYFEFIKDVDSRVLIKPMLAYDWKDYKDKLAKQEPQVVFLSKKYDGICCLISKDGLFTRTGEVIKSCDHILESLNRMNFFKEYPDVVLHGELYNEDIGFNNIMSIVRRDYNTSKYLNTQYNRKQPKDSKLVDKLNSQLINFYVYDYIDSAPYKNRYKELFEGKYRCLIYMSFIKLVIQLETNTHDLTTIDKHYKQCLEEGYGQMIKFNTPYINEPNIYLKERSGLTLNIHLLTC